MKYYQLAIRGFFVPLALAMLISVLVFPVSIGAQKAQLVESANLDQCRNGPTASPVSCTGGAWVNGNAGPTNSHWAENQFLSYRMLFDGLTPGPTIHSVTIGYDITKNGPHAIDYLGTFNFTDSGSDPCSGVTGCTLATPSDVITVPQDTVTVTNQINPNTGMPIVQLPGQFKMWGGDLLSVGYETYGGGEERRITVTFTASVANPVLAWGGHVAWIGSWGAGNAAGGIMGSPYHMRLVNFNGSGGNQDHSLSADAVVASGAVFIKKEVRSLNPQTPTSSSLPFPFTASANFGLTSFSLIDDNTGPGIDTQQSLPITSFGAGNTITVTESMGPLGWTLSNVNCVENGIADSTQNSLGPAASIIVQLGEVVVCTFTNTQLTPSAGMVFVEGTVTTATGRAISRVRMTITDQNGSSRSALTSDFGYYRFDDVEAGQGYVLSAFSKSHLFTPRVITPSDDLTGVDFVANP